MAAGFDCQKAKAQTNEWAWMSGSSLSGSYGIYGTLEIPQPTNAPGGRSQPVTWTDSQGNLWLFGGEGFDSVGNSNALNDLWEYTPSTSAWTWIDGAGTLSSGFTSGGGIYGTLGTPAPGNIPPGRNSAVSWIDAKGNLWLFGGTSYSTAGDLIFHDLWEFSPITKEWAWMGGTNSNICPSACAAGVYGTLGQPAASNMPGARYNAASWTDSKGNFWLFGGFGYDSSSNGGSLNDLWRFSPSTNEWTWVGGGNATGQPTVYGTMGSPAPGNVPGARSYLVSWIDGNDNLWLFGGAGSNDLWKYNPNTNEWAWISGTASAQPASHPVTGVYGTLQTSAPENVPGSRQGAVSWTDVKGNLWMFGGVGDDSTGTQSMLNDLWEFSPSTSEWAWMGGSAAVSPDDCSVLANWCGQFGVYGPMQAPALRLVPGGRYAGAAWADGKGNLWLFGGIGYDSIGNPGYLNDLWVFQPNTGSSSVTASPTFLPGSNTYTSWQSVMIDDATPGATINYTINGATPASVYTGPITVSSTETIEAIASTSGYANSNIATANYVANLPQAAAPVFSMAQGNYAAMQTVSLSDATPGATLYYAIGAIPTTASTVYSGPITVASSEVVEAIAVSRNYLNSAVAAAVYNIGVNQSLAWTWAGGSSSIGNTCYAINIFTQCGEPGWYGTLGNTAAGNIPGGREAAASWTDSAGNMWLFGGNAVDGGGTPGFLNDLWMFSPSTGQWTWRGGSSTVSNHCIVEGSITFCGEPGIYGTLGSAAKGNIPGGREWATTWTDPAGHLWLFGGWGFDVSGTLGFLNDLWEFDPATGEWTWVSGSTTTPCLYCGLAGNYGTLGTTATTNVPGSRYQTGSWVDNSGHLWLFGGIGYDSRLIQGYLNDLWEFDPSSDQWTWRSGSKVTPVIDGGMPGVYGTRGIAASSNVPGGRQDPMSWVDHNGHFWLFGGIAADVTDTSDLINDLWEFDPSTSLWTWVSGSPTGGSAGLYGTLGIPAAANSPGARGSASTWIDGAGNLWLFGGSGADANPALGTMNDLWKFNPSIDEWTWMGGSSNTFYLPGVYGLLGTLASSNFPGARGFATTWTDTKGNFWLFGGAGYDTQGIEGPLNDLWEFGVSAPPALPPPSAATPIMSLAGTTYSSAQQLTISEATAGATIYYTTNGLPPTISSPVYAVPIAIASTETVQAIAVVPDYANSSTATATYNINLPPAPTPTLSLAGGAYTSSQSLTMSDSIAGATLYYTTNGLKPTTSSTQYTGAITLSSTQTIQAIAIAPGYSVSAVASANYILNLPPDFSIALLPASLTITAGQSGTAIATVTPLNGFNSTVSFSCSGLLSGTSCSFSPGTVTPIVAPSSTTATIAASSSAKTLPGPFDYAPVVTLTLTLGFLRHKKYRLVSGLISFVAATLTLICLSACSGVASNSNANESTPIPESGTVTITATSGSISHSAMLTLVVN